MDSIRILNPSNKKNWNFTSSFPGTEGNPFDKVLRNLQKINRIPFSIFYFILIILGGLLTFFRVNNWLMLIFFSIIDLLMLLLLPRKKISFGEINSQVFLLFILRAPFVWLSFPFNLIFQIIGSFLVIYGFFIEPQIIQLTYLQYNHPFFLSKLRIIHLSDIHLEYLGIREEKILKRINSIRPDLILFTGDFLNLSNIRNQKSIDQIIALFNALSEISPIYYVSGSPAVDIHEVVQTIQDDINAVRLHNENKSIISNGNKINLIGITCTHQPHKDISQFESLCLDGYFNILLYHSPDLIFEIDPAMNVNLMLSGHTHGGQIRLPFLGAIFTGSLYGRKLQSGAYKIYDTLLYISRGIGLEGLGAPRVRFLCKPEIIQWEFNSDT